MQHPHVRYGYAMVHTENNHGLYSHLGHALQLLAHHHFQIQLCSYFTSQSDYIVGTRNVRPLL